MMKTRIKIKSGFLMAVFFAAMVIFTGIFSCSHQPVTSDNSTGFTLSRAPVVYLESISGKPTLFPSKMKKVLYFLHGGCKEIPFHRPIALDLDSSGRIYVLDSDLLQILRFPSLKYTCDQVKIICQNQFSAPGGMALSQRFIYISENISGKIKRFTYEGKFVDSFQDSTIIKHPGELAYDRKRGRLFVVEPLRDYVLVFNEEYKLLKKLGGKRGSGLYEFHSPVDVTVDFAGNIYIVDALNRRVVKYNVNFEPVKIYGVYDIVPGAFCFPRAVVVDRMGNLYISDVQFGNIQVFHNNGVLLYYFGRNGKEPFQFYLPIDLALDREGRIYVADQFNNRVQVFQLTLLK